MNSKLAELIQLNKIDEEVLFEALHKDILESVLSEICEYMKSNESNHLSVRRIYYRSSCDLDAIRQVVRGVCHLALPQQDLTWLNSCIKAFMKKKPHRKVFSEYLRHELWQKQSQKCCICGKEIVEEESHVDHIVPWDYVGDELENNYQVLCSSCNHHKSNHVSLTVHSIIFNRI